MKTKTIIKNIGICSLAAVAATLVGTDMAMAAGTDFQSTVQNVGQQAQELPKFINFICYVLGIGLVGKGILTGKKYSEQPAQTTLMQVIGPLGVGGMLLALPTVAEIAINSTTGNNGNATISTGFTQSY